MRLPRRSIQRFLVAAVLTAIFLWAVAILVPEAVMRWKARSAWAAPVGATGASRGLALRLARRIDDGDGHRHDPGDEGARGRAKGRVGRPWRQRSRRRGVRSIVWRLEG